jgi:hypothetical protein
MEPHHAWGVHSFQLHKSVLPGLPVGHIGLSVVGQELPQTFLFMQPLKFIEHLGILLGDTRDVCGAYIDSRYAIAQPKTAGGRRSGLSTALALTSLPLGTPRMAGRWKTVRNPLWKMWLVNSLSGRCHFLKRLSAG